LNRGGREFTVQYSTLSSPVSSWTACKSGLFTVGGAGGRAYIDPIQEINLLLSFAFPTRKILLFYLKKDKRLFCLLKLAAHAHHYRMPYLD
jgi:hypothetical protein